jgi:hypothetical protein
MHPLCPFTPSAPVVLQLCHARILDTVTLYPHPKGPPARSKLKFLATKVSMSRRCRDVPGMPALGCNPWAVAETGWVNM